MESSGDISASQPVVFASSVSTKVRGSSLETANSAMKSALIAGQAGR